MSQGKKSEKGHEMTRHFAQDALRLWPIFPTTPREVEQQGLA
jgi:hypothetical protein